MAGRGNGDGGERRTGHRGVAGTAMDGGSGWAGGGEECAVTCSRSFRRLISMFGSTSSLHHASNSAFEIDPRHQHNRPSLSHSADAVPSLPFRFRSG